MTAEQINSICRRNRIPVQYHVHFRRLVLDYLILSPKFGRLLRRNPRFKKCLGEIKGVLSAPYRWFFDIPVAPAVQEMS
jgi:hypothetical protein